MLALFLGGGAAWPMDERRKRLAMGARLLPKLEPGGEDARAWLRPISPWRGNAPAAKRAPVPVSHQEGRT